MRDRAAQLLRRSYAVGRRLPTRLVFERRGTDFGRPSESGYTWLLRSLPRRSVGPNDVFVDFGSGVGRVVYIAARFYAFKRVMGVEISEELNRTARHNIDVSRDRLRCDDVDLVTTDVREFAIPDDMTVAYFQNPFPPEILAGVIDDIVRSLQRAPRRVTILYANPLAEKYILDTGRFAVTRRVRLRGEHSPARIPEVSVLTSLPTR